MAGTSEGGRRAAATNKAKFGDDFYSRIGKIGGSVMGTGGGFAYGDNARVGGKRSRRGHKLLERHDTYGIYLNKKTNKKVKIAW